MMQITIKCQSEYNVIKASRGQEGYAYYAYVRVDGKFYSSRNDNKQEAIEEILKEVQKNHRGVMIAYDIQIPGE